MSENEQLFREATEGLRVALVHDWLTGMRGGEKVLEAIAELFPDAPIYTLFAFPEKISEALRRHPIHTSLLQKQLPQRLLARFYRHLLPLFPRHVEEFDLTGYDLVISTSHCVVKGVLPAPDAVHLCYCHSPMRYAWDLEQHYFPKRRGVIADIRAHLLSSLRTWDASSSARVDHFWANSSWVADRIARYYGREAEVLHPPVEVDAFSGDDLVGENGTQQDETVATHATETYNDPNGTSTSPAEAQQGFALAVSALVPYKKLDLAIQACEARAMPLKIVGTGPEQARLERLAGAHTELLGRVDDATLQRLFQEAQVFIQPGVEDFGIAAVEALASATPVLAVGRGGVLDIVENGRHGVLYDGFEVSDVSAAIDKFLKIRFNALELKTHSRSFSRALFTERIRSSIAHHVQNRARRSRHRKSQSRVGLQHAGPSDTGPSRTGPSSSGPHGDDFTRPGPTERR